MAEKRKKRKGKGKLILGGLAFIVVVGVGYFAVQKTTDVIPSVGSFFGGEDNEEVRSTQTKKSKQSEEQLKERITAKNLSIAVDEYGLLKLSAQAEMPDFSAYFANCLETAEAEAKDAYAFEELLFSQTEAALADAGTASYITQEVTVNLTAEDGTKTKDDWTDEELMALAKQSAFEDELAEFAADILGDYLSRSTNWEAVKAGLEDEENAGQAADGAADSSTNGEEAAQ